MLGPNLLLDLILAFFLSTFAVTIIGCIFCALRDLFQISAAKRRYKRALNRRF